MAPLTFADDSDVLAILDTGEYGGSGEAELLSITARPLPGENPDNKGKFYADICAAVEHPDFGRCFVHTQPFGKFNCQLGSKAGSKGKMFMAQLGVTDPQFEDPDTAEDPDNLKLIGEDLGGTKVIVQVQKRTWKDKQTGDEQAAAGITNIFRRD